MNTEIFMTLLTICSIITCLVVGAIKKSFELFGKTYASNVIAFFVAIPVGCAGALLYYYLMNISINVLNCIFAVFLGLSNWVGAMIGYDKVIQAINQIKNKQVERSV